VSLVIEPEQVVEGDAGLLRVALENLLGNAWKYSTGKPVTKIEFGRSRTGEMEFFVRDEGAGFDMELAVNLFKPFCRMHSAQEFPGTGIGLATVQRVINRHGGSIRAEATHNRGAAFFFTIPSLSQRPVK
jgi:K+-sensing histidine kinase KdpD